MTSKTNKLFLLPALVAAFLVFAATPALAAENWGALGAFGSEGSGAGQFEEPSGIAVNDTATGPNAGDMYVVDKGNKRVEEYSKTGAFGKEFTLPGGFEVPEGIAVDNSGSASDPSKEDVYVIDESHKVIDKFSATGAYVGPITGTCEKEGEAPPTCTGSTFVPFEEIDGVAVDSHGVVWVSQGNAGSGEAGGALDSFSDAQPNVFLAGLTLEVASTGFVEHGLAVDSEDNLYIVHRGTLKVEKLTSAGEVRNGELGGVEGVSGIAVDPVSNDVFIDNGASVAVLEPDESLLEPFGEGLFSGAGGLAVDPSAGASGYAYVVQPAADDVLILEHSATPQSPPLAPVTKKVEDVTANSATFTGELNPKEAAGGVGYFFSYHAGAGTTCTEPGSEHTPLDNNGLNLTGNSPISVSATVTTLVPNTEYVVCLVAVRFGQTAGTPEESFKTPHAAPDIFKETLTGLTAEEGAKSIKEEKNPAEEGKLTALINPENEETTYQFEYSTEGSVSENKLENAQTDSGTEPLPAESVPKGKTVTVSNIPLQPDTSTFYYRVVATNGTGTTTGAVQEYTKAPLIEGESVSGVTTTSTELEAEINPDFMSQTTYVFEYATSKTTLEEGNGTVLGRGGLPQTANEPFLVRTEIAHLQPDETYYYRVLAENEVFIETGSPKGISYGPIQHFTTFTGPTATTGEAQNITRTSATLSGTVDPKGAETTYSFQYISETAYQAALENGVADPYEEGETTVPISAGSGTAPVAAGPTQASGLRPGETYHDRLLATNRYGVQSIGQEATFTTTSATPPSVSTGTASGVSQNTATLYGTVTTNGLQTNYGFEIATEPFQPGTHVPTTGLGAIGGALTEEVHVTLSELQPATTYYYRVTATNADGTIQGQPGTFTTPGFPTLISPPASPAPFAFTKVAFPAEGKESGTKALTTKQKLAKALQQCKQRKSKRRKATCEKQARAKYGAAKKKGRR